MSGLSKPQGSGFQFFKSFATCWWFPLPLFEVPKVEPPPASPPPPPHLPPTSPSVRRIDFKCPILPHSRPPPPTPRPRNNPPTHLRFSLRLAQKPKKPPPPPSPSNSLPTPTPTPTPRLLHKVEDPFRFRRLPQGPLGQELGRLHLASVQRTRDPSGGGGRVEFFCVS